MTAQNPYHVETTIGGRTHGFESGGGIRIGATADHVLLRFTDGTDKVEIALPPGMAARLAQSMTTAVAKIAESGGGGLMPSRTFTPGGPGA
jgi:hypothetical protein